MYALVPMTRQEIISNLLPQTITNLKQEGTGNHNAQIVLTGNYLTTLNVLQQGSNNQSYNLTQNCQTVGGCTVNVTQN